VLIPALSTRHPQHRRARAIVIDRVSAIPAHVIAEAFASLTAMPQPLRVGPAATLGLLRALQLKPLALPASGYLDTLAGLAADGIVGGATYDGLIARTARHHDHGLLTRDRRAVRTYRAIGVDYELLEP
jgi:predicted nucleic acid-binding protein